MTLYYPPTLNGLQKQLSADLTQGYTTALTLNNTTGIQNKPGVVIIDRIDTNGNALASSVREWVIYTGVSGSTLTGLTRGIGGSSDQTHTVNSVVEFVPDITVFQGLLDALANSHTTAGALDTTKVVDLTTAQTLSAKTLTAPKIATGGFIADANGNEQIIFVTTASAVNEVKMTNAATGGTPIIEASGETNVHLTVRGKGNGLTKVSVLRQDDTSNTYKHNSVILTGWGYKQAAAAQTDSEAVTFGITFDQVPILICSSAGGKSTAPSGLADMSTNYYGNNIFPMSISTTGFTAQCGSLSYDGANPPNLSGYWAYTWIAIGELT